MTQIKVNTNTSESFTLLLRKAFGFYLCMIQHLLSHAAGMTFELSGMKDYSKENPMRDLDNIISNGM